MTYAEAEINLCRRLHELGVRPGMRYGDFYMDVYGRLTLCVYASASPAHHPYPGEVDFLLWSWSRCREYLAEREWMLWSHSQLGSSVKISFYKNPAEHIVGIEGQTDLEAILQVMVQVAEWKNE